MIKADTPVEITGGVNYWAIKELDFKVDKKNTRCLMSWLTWQFE